MADAAESLDTGADSAEDAFAIGAVVHDREDDDPNAAIVVNHPPQPADEWLAYRETTVAEDNPEYPADAPVIVVVFADALRAAFPDWAGDDSLPLTAITESDASHYSFPAPRLTIVESDVVPSESSSDSAPPAANGGADESSAADLPPDEEPAPASTDTADLSAAMQALKERLEDGGMAVEIESDGQALQATKLGDTYRVRPGEIIEGDGVLRSQLAPIVDEFE